MLTQEQFDLLRQVRDFAVNLHMRPEPDWVSDLHAWIGQAQRERMKEHINECAEHGEVAVLESGRDCDCVEYSGRVHIIQATIDAYEALDDGIASWADGPYRLEVVRPSMTKFVEYNSRDLVMEAHENGHPHSIVSRFP